METNINKKVIIRGDRSGVEFGTLVAQNGREYPNRELFAYHHVLTGSCRMERESFCKDKGIYLDSSTTVREFVELTKDSYGGETIRKLPEVYEVTE